MKYRKRSWIKETAKYETELRGTDSSTNARLLI